MHALRTAKVLLQTKARPIPRPPVCRYYRPNPIRFYQTNPDEPKLSLTFTCTAPGCDGHRSSHVFSKRSYEHGVVLVECPGCHNRHLIADHLGWFKDGTEGGKNKTLEEIMAAKGVPVTRGQIVEKGTFEFNGTQAEDGGETKSS
ncbi:zf-DNL-domain-containing protein [Dacryopinax primogenitus]|uniref:Zf-DNL-domain-containing protein n=1 Tax=Dacryopinax primogenitus (strain DJM 731) TaxID=1858805 RepID=M5FTK7_DACPD|nr:zf-DNL-domain-containing protein [Dacryopinax primogenitus]EJT96576.1 zf-DNL-domain-containing protein [Dacryopinax primogenitus]